MRKHYWIFISIMLFMFTVINGYTQPITSWVTRFNGLLDSMDVAKSITVDGAGNVYVTGYSQDLGVFTDIVTIKYRSSDGVELWRATYDGPAHLFDEGNKIVVDNNYAYVTGFCDGLFLFADYVTLKYDRNNGTLIWAARYDGSSHLDDQSNSIAVDQAGNVYVTGYATNGIIPQKDYTTIMYSTAGTQQWVRTYDRGSEDIAYALALDGNNNIFVTGSSRSSALPGSEDYLTIKYNNSGTQQWTQAYNGTGNNEDRAYAITVDNADNVIVTGLSRSGLLPASDDYETIKYNNSGTQQWENRYNGTGNGQDRAYAITVDNSDNVIVTGESEQSPSNPDYATVKYNSAGTQQWASRYNGTGNNEDRAYAITVDNSDNVYVTGSSRSGSLQGSEDYATLKYNQAGGQQWVAIYNGTGNNEDRAYAITVDNSDNVFVTGSSRHSALLGSEDYLTIKYSGGTLVEINSNQLPSVSRLMQNYPNPFNPSTYIRFDVASRSNVRLSLYNLLGNEVAVLLHQQLNPGTYETQWNSSGFSSGVYFCRLTVEDVSSSPGSTYIETKQMVLIK